MQLRVPGPTPLPQSVRDAGARDMINHRGPEFAELLRDVTRRLKHFYQTSNDVLILTASGTGAMEAGIVNFLSPGDRVLAVSIGEFGERFAKIAGIFGANVTMLQFPAGTPADPARIGAVLNSSGPFKAVLVTHNETSTGITNDLEGIARQVAASGALLIVDAISSLSSIDLKTDAWGCDVVLSASQKGWMVPPGLAFVSVSPRAWDAYGAAKMPRYYWDLGEARKYAARGQTPATPAVSLFFQLNAALALMEEEGRENVFQRHHRIAGRVRRGVLDLGLELFALPARASNTVTSVKAPPDVEVAELLEAVRNEGVVLAGGQGSLAGKIFRIGHLGFIDDSDVDVILSALGTSLARLQPVGSARSGG